VLLPMRTTITLDARLHRRAKRCAARSGLTLGALVESALRAYLVAPGARGRYRFHWSKARGRLRPGFPIDSRAAMYDLLEPIE
jgi:hypothetical protein